MINESAENFIGEMFFEIKNAMQRDSALITEVSMQIRSRYPVLIHYHQELMNQMSEEDYFELKNIKKRIFYKLDSLNNLNINIVDTISGQKELPLDAKANLIAISNIIENYEKEYQEIYVLLLEHQQRWDKEMEQIFLRHYPESNLNSMKEYGMFFQRTGIKKELDKMLIYMLDPEDKSRYFQVLMIIQKVEEQIFEIHK